MSWKTTLRKLWRDSKSNKQPSESKSSRETSAPIKTDEERITDQGNAARHDLVVQMRSNAPAKKTKEQNEARTVFLKPMTFRELRYQNYHDTQFKGLTKDSPRMQMIVGFDFGTSYTKVVLGEERIHYAVPMQEEKSGEDRYLLPAVLYIRGDGSCHIGEADAGDCRYDDLKMRLLRQDFSTETRVLIASYMALVLRHARGWLMTEKRAVYEGTRFEWFVNIGLPTEDTFDKHLESVYRDVTLAAWLLSGRSGAITLSLAEEALALPVDGKSAGALEGSWAWLHPDAVKAFPEFAAQISAYVQSPMKSKDLHALIDIGGGTLDVTLFNVVEDRDEDNHRYPILARSVHHLGTEFLIKERLRQCGSGTDWPLTAQDSIPIAEQMAKTLRVSLQSLDEADTDFRHRVQRAIGSQFVYTKKHRYPHSSTWTKGLPVFIYGGGSQCDFYQNALKSLFPPHATWQTLREHLPRPTLLEVPGFNKEDIGRLAVAYGLSFDEIELGEIIRPENILDDQLDTSYGQRLRDSRRVDKDMV